MGKAMFDSKFGCILVHRESKTWAATGHQAIQVSSEMCPAHLMQPGPHHPPMHPRLHLTLPSPRRLHPARLQASQRRSDVPETRVGPNSRTAGNVIHCPTVNCGITAPIIQSPARHSIHIFVGKRTIVDVGVGVRGAGTCSAASLATPAAYTKGYVESARSPTAKLISRCIPFTSMD